MKRGARDSMLTFFLDYGLDDVMYVVVNVFVDNYAFVNDGTLFRIVNLEFNECIRARDQKGIKINLPECPCVGVLDPQKGQCPLACWHEFLKRSLQDEPMGG